jgi:hypothetical protein
MCVCVKLAGAMQSISRRTEPYCRIAHADLERAIASDRTFCPEFKMAANHALG